MGTPRIKTVLPGVLLVSLAASTHLRLALSCNQGADMLGFGVNGSEHDSMSIEDKRALFHGGLRSDMPNTATSSLNRARFPFHLVKDRLKHVAVVRRGEP